MQPSVRIGQFIMGFEELHLIGYLPTPKDVPTIGWGSTGKGIHVGDVWTLEQAQRRFFTDLNGFGAGVTRLLEGAPTTQNQFDALVSLAYNIGLDEDTDTKAEGLGDSTLLRKHKAGDYAGASAEFLKWNKQAGTVLRGLTRRRIAERAIYDEAWPQPKEAA